MRLLPAAIRVLRCRNVSKDFFSARSLQKEKFIATESGPRRFLLPFEYRRAWHVRAVTSICKRSLKSGARKHFVGTHDFATFAANRRETRTEQNPHNQFCARSPKRFPTSRRVRRQRLSLQDGSPDGGRTGENVARKCNIEENPSPTALRQTRSSRFVAPPAEGIVISWPCVTDASRVW